MNQTFIKHSWKITKHEIMCYKLQNIIYEHNALNILLPGID